VETAVFNLYELAIYIVRLKEEKLIGWWIG
jgi:hypothetical protein